MGRPTKLTPDLQERICLHLRYGATRKLAAQAEGIAERTLAYWVAKPAFLQAVERAEAEARTQKLALLHQAAARGSVPAMTWLLERLDPQAYGEPPKRVQVSGEDGGPLPVSVTLNVRQVPRGHDDDDTDRADPAAG